jgi:hypothetical protein
MAFSKTELIIQYLMTLASGVQNIGGRIYRDRVQPLSRNEAPAIVIEPVSDIVTNSLISEVIDWQYVVRVLIIGRGQLPDQATDEIKNELYNLFMADRSLGGRVMDIIPLSIAYDFDGNDGVSGVTTLQFQIKHRTTSQSLEA